jgi:hypothetical protein
LYSPYTILIFASVADEKVSGLSKKTKPRGRSPTIKPVFSSIPAKHNYDDDDDDDDDKKGVTYQI